MADGHIKISRRLFKDDPWWNEPRARTKVEAWIDVIQMAAWKPRRFAIGDHIIELVRGEFIASLRYLADRWWWDKMQVQRWINTALKIERLTRQREIQVGTIYLLVNYEHYQGNVPERETDEVPPLETPKRQPRDSRETGERQNRSSISKKSSVSQEPSAGFLQAWSAYPKRPNNNRIKAWQAWSARVTAGEDETAMLAGTMAYAAFCRATGKEATEFTLQASTFYGPTRRYLDDYTVPKVNGNGKHPPKDDGIRDEPQLQWLEETRNRRVNGVG